MDSYGDPLYWHGRYTGVKDYFDWYQRWVKLQPIIENNLFRSNLILNMGCGNSSNQSL